MSHTTGKHKTHSVVGPAVTLATANTPCVHSTTSSVTPSENKVIKMSCAGTGRNPVAHEPWGEHSSLPPFFL